MKSLLAAAVIGITLLVGGLATPGSTVARTAHSGNRALRVGRDIAPGTYRTRTPAHNCYWARLSGFSGKLRDVKVNDFASGFMVVTIRRRRPGFRVEWLWQVVEQPDARVTDSMTTFGHGTYIVGTDIKPGWYRSSNTNGCYWARLRGFDGSMREIIANGIRLRGHAVVHVKRADAGFQSRGCGTWTRL